jgi:hypothetical protein
MPTKWTYPNTVTQYAESNTHVPWLNVGDDFEQMNLVRSKKDLLHIANSLMNDYTMKTYYLVVKEFDFFDLPEIISGIEVYVNIRRTGRITDDTVQLYLNQPLGQNLATYQIDDIKTYGNETALWGVENLTPIMLDDPEFGIILRYQSHPTMPHQTAPYMEHVQIRVW